MSTLLTSELDEADIAESNLAPEGAPHRGRPLRVMFVITSMPVGGAETLLVNLVRRLDRERFIPEICCLKERGPLGEELAAELPVHCQLLSGKYDLRVLPRLVKLFRQQQVDAVVTVGAGDKMFWGRLAARLAGVPVIAAALHSTGWPDGVGRLNRLLTPLTDAFIAVAGEHGRFLTEHERFPVSKVHVIPNGVDTQRFSPLPDRHAIRRDLGLSPAAAVVTMVAALRAEKNHEMLLDVAARIRQGIPEAEFLVVGDGPRRGELQQRAAELGIANHVHFLGSRPDVPALLTASDVFVLTSHNEANPVSILEAMSIGLPVVATDVGSVHESVEHGSTGYLVQPGDADDFVRQLAALLQNPLACSAMGECARRQVESRWSLQQMVTGYETLLEQLYVAKRGRTPRKAPTLGFADALAEGHLTIHN